MVEFDRSPNPLRDELLTTRFELIDGHLAIPSGPGLGVDVDLARLELHTRPR
jgi:D-galactarolactone cycloisomerase